MSQQSLTRRERDVLMAAAVAAPSLHNTQPWLFAVVGRSVWVYADTARQLRHVDPDGRQLLLGCGAAVLNLRLAATRLGCRPVVHLLPDPNDPTLLAAVGLGDCEPDAEPADALYDAIPLRHTNRFPFEDGEVPADQVADLVEAARSEGCELLVVADPVELGRIAELVRLADLEHDQRPDVTIEAAVWTGVVADRADGVPGYALGPLADDSDSIVRDLRRGAPVPDRPRASFEHAPLMALLVSPADDRAAWLAAGQALQRVLLTATTASLSVSFVNQPLEVTALRSATLPASHPAGHPQMLLRIGRGIPVPATPRRAPTVPDASATVLNGGDQMGEGSRGPR